MDPEVQRYLNSLSPQQLATLQQPVGLFPGAGIAPTPQEREAASRQEDKTYRAQRREQANAERDASSNRVRNAIFDTASKVVAPEWAGRAAAVADYFPVVGDISGGEDAVQAFNAGNYGQAALLGGLGVAGLVPGSDALTKPLAKAVKGAPSPTALVPTSVTPTGVAVLDEAALPPSGVAALDEAVTPAPAAFDLEAAVNAPPGSDPRYLGAAPDRTALTFLRYPPKASTPRVSKALTALRDPKNPVRAEMVETIQRGVDLGGADWYNTEELRDWFVGELGEKEGAAQWEEFMDLMGTNSAGSNVQQNIASASAVRQRMANDPAYVESLASIQKLPEGQALARGRPKNYGHQYQGLQELTTAKRQQGEWLGAPEPGVPAAQGSWAENQKPKGFAQSLKGGMSNIAADLHFTRFMAMGSKDPEWLSGQMKVGGKLHDQLAANPKLKPYLRTNEKGFQTFNAKKAAKDGNLTFEEAAVIGDETPDIFVGKPESNEYKDFEDFTNEIGAEMGLTGPQVQAALWMGAANKTGVSDMSAGTFMDIIRARADATAAKTGKTRAEVMKSFIRDKGLLSIAPLGALPYLNQLGTDEKEERNGA